MWEIFAFGSLWFWLATLFVAGFIIRYTEDEHVNFPANLWLAGFLVALYFFGNSESFKAAGSFVIHKPGSAIAIVVAYMGLGVAWSTAKWFFFLRKIREKTLESNDLLSGLYNYQVKFNKERIIHWMIYWPLSALWTMMNDPVRRVFEVILSKIGGYYDRMAEKMLGDRLEDHPSNIDHPRNAHKKRNTVR